MSKENLLYPYIGTRIKAHLGDSGQGGHTLSNYAMDRSGKKSYTFNSYGFRDDEPDPNAKKTIFFGGCSHTFGLGLNSDETWPSHFTNHYVRYHGLERQDVAALNFANAGSSNDYLVRTLMTQATRQKPDLMVCQFTHINRREYVLNAMELEQKAMCVASIGPWLAPGKHHPIVRNTLRLAKQEPMTKEEKQIFDEVFTFAKSYYKKVQYELGEVIDTIKNILLLQMFCESRGISYFFSIVDHELLNNEVVQQHQALRPMYGLINQQQLVDFCILDEDIKIDLAADDRHPGPKSNVLFAEKLWDAYADFLKSSR